MIKQFNAEADSSTVHSARYNTETQEMELIFKSSAATLFYLYKNVPETVYDEFAEAESKGHYFMYNIYNLYEFEKIPIQ